MIVGDHDTHDERELLTDDPDGSEVSRHTGGGALVTSALGPGASLGRVPICLSGLATRAPDQTEAKQSVTSSSIEVMNP